MWPLESLSLFNIITDPVPYPLSWPINKSLDSLSVQRYTHLSLAYTQQLIIHGPLWERIPEIHSRLSQVSFHLKLTYSMTTLLCSWLSTERKQPFIIYTVNHIQ